jgi:hypothetical protein
MHYWLEFFELQMIRIYDSIDFFKSDDLLWDYLVVGRIIFRSTTDFIPLFRCYHHSNCWLDTTTNSYIIPIVGWIPQVG